MNIQMVRTKRQFSALVLTGVIVTGSFTAWLLACGPFSDSFETFVTFEPAHRSAFGRGQLSVVSPEYARRYLVQAYRVLSGQPALPNAALTTSIRKRLSSQFTLDVDLTAERGITIVFGASGLTS